MVILVMRANQVNGSWGDTTVVQIYSRIKRALSVVRYRSQMCAITLSLRFWLTTICEHTWPVPRVGRHNADWRLSQHVIPQSNRACLRHVLNSWSSTIDSLRAYKHAYWRMAQEDTCRTYSDALVLNFLLPFNWWYFRCAVDRIYGKVGIF